MVWYYDHNGQHFGPFSFHTLKQLADSGRLQPTDYLMKEGDSQWHPATSIPELFDTPVSTKPSAVKPSQQASTGKSRRLLTAVVAGIQSPIITAQRLTVLLLVVLIVVQIRTASMVQSVLSASSNGVPVDVRSSCAPIAPATEQFSDWRRFILALGPLRTDVQNTVDARVVNTVSSNVTNTVDVNVGNPVDANVTNLVRTFVANTVDVSVPDTVDVKVQDRIELDDIVPIRVSVERPVEIDDIIPIRVSAQ